jgi:hypothetical protein
MAVMLVLLKGGIYDARRRDAFMWHDIFTSFVKIGIGVQGILLRFCLRNLKGCNVGISDVEGVYEVHR